MKPLTIRLQVSSRVLLLLLVAGMMTQDAAGHDSGHKKDGHHHHHHQVHHEPRAARTRREQDIAGKTTPDNMPLEGTEETKVIQFRCTDGGGGFECAKLVNSRCDTEKQLCVCPVSYPILDLENSYCVKEAKLNTTCQFTSQCIEADEFSFCQASICVCGEGYNFEEYPNIGFICATKERNPGPGALDPAMIGVLAGLALMFIIICVVLRLFSKARFRENRSIFNTPNPRLMNASLFKDSKLLSPARGDRRGSRASVRVPSRAPSVTSVNAAARSPNGSLAKAVAAAVSYQRLPSLESL
ncbi:uncharacterized protein LOC121876043 isoform X3 [Homarus americanus]|uniref:uncharacterized protein LOC121876043 isoform X3 n=1 Tax=Homarus americanus TaxID=6706 RepID=UPI001C494B70|nr:uncharacterized protein LOC121876043 isoform X3 [Homarus americanus]